MKIRIVLLLLAIIFGVTAVIGVMIYLNNVKSSIEKEGELMSVVVAAQNIPKETRVEDMTAKKFTELKQIPKKYLVSGALDSLEKYKEYIAKTEIIKGEQITAEKLGKIEDLRISFTVPEGLIAVSVPYDEIRGVSNLINVGDKVNVIGTFTPSKDDLVLFNKDIVTESLMQLNETGTSTTDESGLPGSGWFPTEKMLDESSYILYPVTKILLWNIEVLYIGSKIVSSQEDEKAGSSLSEDSSSKNNVELKTVTLAVTPEQAEKLIFSEELGRVWFALVPADGIDEEETPGRTYINIMD